MSLSYRSKTWKKTGVYICGVDEYDLFTVQGIVICTSCLFAVQ